MRRLSGRSARPKSVADIADAEDELAQNLANLRLTNSAAPEFSSIEQLEAAQYGQTYSRPQYGGEQQQQQLYAQVRSVRTLQHQQVRPSRSLHFNQAEERSRTWNQQSVSRYRQETEHHPARHKRLSVSSFRYEDTGDTTTPTSTTTTASEQRNAFKQKVQRSLSCERTKQASKQVVKYIKISSDKIQSNLSKISCNLNSKLDTRLSSLSCVAGEEQGVAATDWYRPPPEDPSGGFRAAVRTPVRLTTPTSSLGSRGRHHHQIPQSPTSSVFSCTKPQVST